MNRDENLADTLDLTPRRSVWLDHFARLALADSIQQALTGGDCDDPTSTYTLQQVLAELHVVEARRAYYEDVDARARRADGLPETAEPVRLSDSEIESILNLADLPEGTRHAVATAAHAEEAS